MNANTCAVNSRRNLGMRQNKWNPCKHMRFKPIRAERLEEAQNRFNSLFKSRSVTA